MANRTVLHLISQRSQLTNLRVTRSHLSDCRKVIAGRFTSILAVVGFLSFALPAYASLGAWSYAGVNYPSQAAAVAAMQAASPPNAALTQMAGITGMGGSVRNFVCEPVNEVTRSTRIDHRTG